MELCSCGNPVDGRGVQCRRCAALQVLELGADATDGEIKAAYHVLVKVWHPDRFQSDKTLKDAAEAKLKNVNSAYVFLCSAAATGGRWQQTGPAPASAASPRPSASAGSQRPPSSGQPTAKQPPTRRSTGTARSKVAVFTWVFPALKFGFGIVLVAFALLMARYLWIAFDVQGPSSGVADVLGGGKDNMRWFLKAPKRRFLAAVEHDLRRLDFRSPAPGALPEAAEIPSAAASQSRQTASAKTVGRQPAVTQATPLKLYSYITAGSTRDEVIEQQGAPTASSDTKLVYGSSELYLKDGSVVGWRIDPQSPIKVKLWPESSVDASLDHFSVGSTKDVVLVVQGTPTAFTQDEFEYGGSVVYFQNNRVVNWKNDPASIPLRARLN
jgi:hypothetical protein